MASTYSTNLALELIGTGDQSGTWGTTTNTNLGTLIEQAISGVVTQAMADANQTITIPNGVFSVGEQINVAALGDGLVTIDSDGTTVLNATPGTVLRTKYSSATIICIATNTFLIVGDLS